MTGKSNSGCHPLNGGNTENIIGSCRLRFRFWLSSTTDSTTACFTCIYFPISSSFHMTGDGMSYLFMLVFLKCEDGTFFDSSDIYLIRVLRCGWADFLVSYLPFPLRTNVTTIPYRTKRTVQKFITSYCTIVGRSVVVRSDSTTSTRTSRTVPYCGQHEMTLSEFV